MKRRIRAEVYPREDGDIGVRFVGSNGKVTFWSEGYASKSNAKRALKSHLNGVRAQDVDVIDLT